MKQKFTGLICGILALLALPAAGEDKMINYIPEQAEKKRQGKCRKEVNFDGG